MSDTPAIAEWHERILRTALEWKDQHSDFTFSLRTQDITGQSRLKRGYWFPGNERYLFFPPFRLNDQNNKTKTIGFVIRFDARGEPKRSELQIVFDSLKNSALRPVHHEIVQKLGPFEKSGAGEKYRRAYPQADPLEAFRVFLSEDYPRLRAIINASGQADAFLVSGNDFGEMLGRIDGNSTNTIDPGEHGEVSHGRNSEDGEPRNLILYGPPGTGKTHWLRQKFAEYTDAGTEVDLQGWLKQTVASNGWRSVIAAALEDLGGSASVPTIREHIWTVAKTRERNRDSNVSQTLWGYLQEHTPPDVDIVKKASRRPPYIFTRAEESVWSLLPDWREQDPDAASLYETLRSGPQQNGEEAVLRYRVVTFHPSFTYEDFVRGIRPVTDEETGTTRFELVDGAFKQICDEARLNSGKRYALFIDEINRANISKVFGELITLIEPDKRTSYDGRGRQIGGMAVQLPGSSGTETAEEPFGVPSNLDLYGTMNTADRSIALLDIALRRRFEFREVEPDYSMLDEPIGPIDIGRMLRRINDRLEYLLDRDHRIGHAYLMQAETVEDLRDVFQVQIIPLLQEYFFDDFGRVALVLATAPGAPPFLTRERLVHGNLFPGAANPSVPGERFRYTITDAGSWTEESFAALYADAAGEPPAE